MTTSFGGLIIDLALWDGTPSIFLKWWADLKGYLNIDLATGIPNEVVCCGALMHINDSVLSFTTECYCEYEGKTWPLWLDSEDLDGKVVPGLQSKIVMRFVDLKRPKEMLAELE